MLFDENSRELGQREVQEASQAFAGTCGESCVAGQNRFVPAFKNVLTDEVALSKLADGALAPMHLITFLPEDWAAQTDKEGRVLKIARHVIAGFWRDGRFFTREQAAAQS